MADAAPQLRKDGAEWEARVALAAAYRLADHYGWDFLIYNHLAMRVPGEPHFLVKPHNLMFDEVRASNLLKLRLDGRPMTFAENVNTAAFTIHTAILNARPEINCTIHTHTVAGMALSAHKKGLLPLTQNAMRFYNRLSYHDFEGYATDMSETERLARDLGPKNRAMILRNHGLLSCGETAAEAVYTMYVLVMCCETQLQLEASGAEITVPSPEVCEHTAQQYEEFRQSNSVQNWAAYQRILDRLDPSYQT